MSDSARELLRDALPHLRAANAYPAINSLIKRITALLAAEPDATPAGDGNGAGND